MEPDQETPARTDIDPVRPALLRLQRECDRLVADHDFISTTPRTTQRLFDQLLLRRDEVGDLGGCDDFNIGDLAWTTINLIDDVGNHLDFAQRYVSSAAQPVEAVTASTSDCDIAIQEALPRIREQCIRLIAQQDFTLPEHERVDRRVDGIQSLTGEIQELTGLQFNHDGLLESTFGQQTALRSIDQALHAPILQTVILLEDALCYATSISDLLREEQPGLADRVEDPFDTDDTDSETAGEVEHIDEAQVAQTIAGMKRTTFESIRNVNKAAGSDDAEFPDACPVCLEVWDSRGEIVQLPCHFTHVLHEECAREVLSSHTGPSVPKCPLCRRAIPLE